MIIDCISDLHGHYPDLSGGDLLIVAGDLTARDNSKEYIEFGLWYAKQEYKHKILIAGNHDNLLVHSPEMFHIPALNMFQLYDSGTKYREWPNLPKPDESTKGTEFETKDFKIWGSPWTKTFKGMNPHCKAFTLDTEEELAAKWALIPEDIDILITHSPPYGILDTTTTGIHAGSKSLADKIVHMTRPPLLWVWGHIHEAYGMDIQIRQKVCQMVNCSHVNEHYRPVNKPIRIIL